MNLNSTFPHYGVLNTKSRVEVPARALNVSHYLETLLCKSFIHLPLIMVAFHRHPKLVWPVCMRKNLTFSTLSMLSMAMMKSRLDAIFFLISSPNDTVSVFHLPKKSGNSGLVVNETRLFHSFHWKFSRINGIPEKVVPFSRWKLPNGKFVFHWQICCLYHQFHACRGLLSSQASLEWDLWQMEHAFPKRKFPIENFQIFL